MTRTVDTSGLVTVIREDDGVFYIAVTLGNRSYARHARTMERALETADNLAALARR